PEGWGPGVHVVLDVEASDDGALEARLSRTAHRELRAFLRQWGAALEPANEHDTLFAASPIEQRLLQALGRRVTFSCKERPSSSEAVISELARLAGIDNVVFQWWLGDERTTGFDKNKVAFQVVDLPLEQALHKVEEPAFLYWTVVHDALLVTNK